MEMLMSQLIPNRSLESNTTMASTVFPKLDNGLDGRDAMPRDGAAQRYSEAQSREHLRKSLQKRQLSQRETHRDWTLESGEK